MLRQPGGERTVVEAEAAARDADAAGAEPVAEVCDRAGAERDVNARIELEDALALRLGIAAADGDHALRILSASPSPSSSSSPLIRSESWAFIWQPKVVTW